MNAREEFLREVEGKEIYCAYITTENPSYVEYNQYDDDDRAKLKYCRLRIGYTKAEYEQFLESLNFEYNDGFGTQELYGNIWYLDGTWSERSEYDGSESWNYQKWPTIPEGLK